MGTSRSWKPVQNACITVHYWVTLHFTVCHCVTLHHCVSLFTAVRHCEPLGITEHYVSLRTVVHRRGGFTWDVLWFQKKMQLVQLFTCKENRFVTRHLVFFWIFLGGVPGCVLPPAQGPLHPHPGGGPRAGLVEAHAGPTHLCGVFGMDGVVLVVATGIYVRYNYE